jgi:nitrite reductase (cytochrome c-552)
VDLIEAVKAAKTGGASTEQLAPALALQRRAQWRLDYIAAENSMGFHAPQEAARVLAEAIDFARQGQVAILTGARAVDFSGDPSAPGAMSVAVPNGTSSATHTPAAPGAPSTTE